jgi:hypothetical protein
MRISSIIVRQCCHVLPKFQALLSSHERSSAVHSQAWPGAYSSVALRVFIARMPCRYVSRDGKELQLSARFGIII